MTDQGHSDSEMTDVPRITDVDSVEETTSGPLTARPFLGLGRGRRQALTTIAPASRVNTRSQRSGPVRPTNSKGKRPQRATAEDILDTIGDVIHVANLTTQSIRSDIVHTQATTHQATDTHYNCLQDGSSQ